MSKKTLDLGGKNMEMIYLGRFYTVSLHSYANQVPTLF